MGVGAQAVPLHERRKSFAAILWIEVNRIRCRFEIVCEFCRCYVSSPACTSFEARRLPPARVRDMESTGIELRTQLYREVGHPLVEQAGRFHQSAVMHSQTACDITALLEVEERPPHGPECDIRGSNDVPVRRVNEFLLAQQGEHDSECGRRAGSSLASGPGLVR